MGRLGLNRDESGPKLVILAPRVHHTPGTPPSVTLTSCTTVTPPSCTVSPTSLGSGRLPWAQAGFSWVLKRAKVAILAKVTILVKVSKSDDSGQSQQK